MSFRKSRVTHLRNYRPSGLLFKRFRYIFVGILVLVISAYIYFSSPVFFSIEKDASVVSDLMMRTLSENDFHARQLSKVFERRVVFFTAVNHYEYKLSYGSKTAFQDVPILLEETFSASGYKIDQEQEKDDSITLKLKKGMFEIAEILISCDLSPKVIYETGPAALPEKKSVAADVAQKKEKMISDYSAEVAMVIDDVANSLINEELLFSLPREITLAILPKLDFSMYVSRKAARLGFDVILHLPLEPLNSKVYPGPGTITTDMTDDEVLKLLDENFKSVPDAIGVNNHMGSKATEERGLMRMISSELKDRGMFFLDSYTSTSSVALQTALDAGLFSIKRDVFLDNRSDSEYIKGQISELIDTAKSRGHAVGIGHDRVMTLQVIKDSLPWFEREGIKLVRLSDLVRTVNTERKERLN